MQSKMNKGIRNFTILTAMAWALMACSAATSAEDPKAKKHVSTDSSSTLSSGNDSAAADASSSGSSNSGGSASNDSGDSGSGGGSQDSGDAQTFTISSFSPHRVSTAGGEDFKILGSNFPLDALIVLGGEPCATTRTSDSELHCTIPARDDGAYQVKVYAGSIQVGAIAANPLHQTEVAQFLVNRRGDGELYGLSNTGGRRTACARMVDGSIFCAGYSYGGTSAYAPGACFTANAKTFAVNDFSNCFDPTLRVVQENGIDIQGVLGMSVLNGIEFWNDQHYWRMSGSHYQPVRGEEVVGSTYSQLLSFLTVWMPNYALNTALLVGSQFRDEDFYQNPLRSPCVIDSDNLGMHCIRGLSDSAATAQNEFETVGTSFTLDNSQRGDWTFSSLSNVGGTALLASHLARVSSHDSSLIWDTTDSDLSFSFDETGYNNVSGPLPLTGPAADAQLNMFGDSLASSCALEYNVTGSAGSPGYEYWRVVCTGATLQGSLSHSLQSMNSTENDPQGIGNHERMALASFMYKNTSTRPRPVQISHTDLGIAIRMADGSVQYVGASKPNGNTGSATILNVRDRVGSTTTYYAYSAFTNGFHTLPVSNVTNIEGNCFQTQDGKLGCWSLPNVQYELSSDRTKAYLRLPTTDAEATVQWLNFE
jgi:hypothetical protein